jgi:hypothetical protein
MVQDLLMSGKNVQMSESRSDIESVVVEGFKLFGLVDLGDVVEVLKCIMSARNLYIFLTVDVKAFLLIKVND